MYKGTNLTSIDASNLISYAFNVARCIFTPHEMDNGLLPVMPGAKGKRSKTKAFLDEHRVQILKGKYLN